MVEYNLSSRQKEIIQLLIAGNSLKKIAEFYVLNVALFINIL